MTKKSRKSNIFI